MWPPAVVEGYLCGNVGITDNKYVVDPTKWFMDPYAEKMLNQSKDLLVKMEEAKEVYSICSEETTKWYLTKKSIDKLNYYWRKVYNETHGNGDRSSTIRRCNADISTSDYYQS